jgi:hypothetical protein
MEDIPNRKEKNLSFDSENVERNKREIIPWIFERWLKISTSKYTVSQTYLVFQWRALTTSVSQISFRLKKMWRKKCVRVWGMGEGNETKQFGNSVL